jgi:hypothetical protein
VQAVEPLQQEEVVEVGAEVQLEWLYYLPIQLQQVLEQ